MTELEARLAAYKYNYHRARKRGNVRAANYWRDKFMSATRNATMVISWFEKEPKANERR